MSITKVIDKLADNISAGEKLQRKLGLLEGLEIARRIARQLQLDSLEANEKLSSSNIAYVSGAAAAGRLADIYLEKFWKVADDEPYNDETGDSYRA